MVWHKAQPVGHPHTASRDAHRRSKMTPCSTAGSTSRVSRIGHLRAGALSSIASASPGARSMFHCGMGGSRLRRRVARRKASHQPPHSAGLHGRACKGRGGRRWLSSASARGGEAKVAAKRKCKGREGRRGLPSASAHILAAHQPPQLPGPQVQARHVLLLLRGQSGAGAAGLAHLHLLAETVSGARDVPSQC